jgi:16S rRNA (cytidine1402-2'-O)-methyltransferase
MNGRAEPLEPGLYFVSTPIGAARDITLRALDILRTADVLAAEDTRTLRHLMDIHGIPVGQREIVAYHDHNGPGALPRLMAHLAEGRAVAYASEAGTPLVADPGFALGREAAAAGHPVRSAPGASAVLAALTVSGLPTDRFLFAGFPPAKGAARREWLAELAGLAATVVIYETPHRIRETLGDLMVTFGRGRRAALCRELTKRFEEVMRDTLENLSEKVAATPPKGEIVLVIDRAPPRATDAGDVRLALQDALRTLSVKDAAQAVAEATGMPRRDVYRLALGLAGARG